MKSKKSHIVAVISAALLFAIITFLPEFDWAFAPTPVETVVCKTTTPIPDFFEEHGSEDEIIYTDSFEIIAPILNQFDKTYMIYGDSYIPRVSTPPPDLALAL